jgi:predicted nucleic acid-binding protein
VTTLVDTGPLVALLNRRDGHHEWTVQQLGQIPPPLFTCEGVLAEAHHLLSGVHDGSRRLGQLTEAGRIDVSFSFATHASRVNTLMLKYIDQPMSFADACLVALAEAVPDPAVLTLDSDFAIYRMHRNRRIAVISPAA